MPALENKIPPPLVALICLCLMWLFSGWFTYSLFALLKAILIALPFVIGVVLGVNAWGAFKEEDTSIDPMHPDKATTLVTEGIYEYSRNPMYAGLLLVLVSFSVYFGSLIGHAIVVGFFFYITKYQIMPEEKILAEKFGDDFERYKNKTNRWLSIK